MMKLEKSTKAAIIMTLFILVGGCIFTKYLSNQAKKESKKDSKTQNNNNNNKNKTTKAFRKKFEETTTVINGQNNSVAIQSKITETTETTTTQISSSDSLSVNNSVSNDSQTSQLIMISETTVKHTQKIFKIEKVFNRFVDGLCFGKCEEQGERERMENVCDYIKDFNTTYNGKKPSFCFLLFDGHSGKECAEKCKNDLPSIIANELKSKKQFTKSFLYCDENEIGNTNNTPMQPKPKSISIESESQETDEIKYKFYNDNDIENDPICQSIKDGFIKMEQKWKKYAQDTKSESGAVAVFVLLIDDILYVANIGDARAVLSKDGDAVRLTEEHTPKNPNEINRAREYINTKTNRIGGEYGDLAVTRAFGDYILNGDKMNKVKGLSAVPYITKIKLTKKHEFLIIACDGLWDVVNDTNAVKTIRRQLRRHQDPTKAADKLVKQAMSLNTTDNVTALVVGFGEKKNDGQLQIVKPLNNDMQLPPGYRRRRRKFG